MNSDPIPRRFLILNKPRFVFLGIALNAFIITEFGRHVYRPYIYSNGNRDFGIADSIGNFGGIIVQIFFTFAVINPEPAKSYWIAILLGIGYIFYEILQPYLPKGVFDWKDIWGTILGTFVALIILRSVWNWVDTPDAEGPTEQS